MFRNFKFGWSCDFEDDSTFFTHINDIPEDEPCALHSCLTAVADLFERPLYGGPKDPEFEKTIPEGCDFPPIHEDDCRRYAEEHHLIFELSTDDDFNCIAVYIADGDLIIGVCSDREVELYEEDKAKKKAFVESVMSQLEEQAGHKVSMSQDELVAKLVETQDRNDELEEENETLKYENEKQSQAILAYREAMKEYVAQLNGYKASDAYFKSRIEEAERLKKENLDMGMQVLRANARAQDIADAYERLKADTCDYEYLLKENEKLIKANTKLAKENEEYRCENALLQNHVSNIASQIEELEKEVHSITKRKHSA